MKDGAVAVIRVTDTDLEGQKIKNIQNYHSVEFKKKEMVFRRYYKIGDGISGCEVRKVGQILTVEDGGVFVDCMHECFPGESNQEIISAGHIRLLEKY